MSYLPFVMDLGSRKFMTMGYGVSFTPEILFVPLGPSAMEYFPKVPRFRGVRKIRKNNFEAYLHLEDYDSDDTKMRKKISIEVLHSSAMEYFPKVTKINGVRKPSKDRFELHLGVEDYSPDDIRVKTIDGFLVVEGQHKERREGRSRVQRQFKRRWPIPEGYKTQALLSQYSNGTLTITSNLVKIEKNNSETINIKKQEGEKKASDGETGQRESDENQSEKKLVKAKTKENSVQFKVEFEVGSKPEYKIGDCVDISLENVKINE